MIRIFLLFFIFLNLPQSTYGQKNKKLSKEIIKILRSSPDSVKASKAVQEIYDFDELRPAFYNEDLYSVIKDSAQFRVVEKYLRKDNIYLNYIREWLYDERGNILEVKHLDTLYRYKKGVVCSAPLVRYKYDDRNNSIEISQWKNDTTKTVNDCDFWHKIESKYDLKDRVQVLARYSIYGKLLTKVKFEYNQKNQKEKIIYLDENDNLDGDNSIILVEYDEQNRVIRKTYKNSNEEISKDPNEICVQKIEYGEGFRIVTGLNSENEILEKVKITGNRVVSQTENLLDDN